MTLSLRILQIDVPAAELAPVTSFWAEALSATPVAAPGAFVHLVDATSVLEVHVQATGQGPPRYHLDLEAAPGSGGGETSDRDAEVARLVALGGSEGRRFDEGYTVVHDPAGLELCVIDPDAAVPTPVRPRAGAHGWLSGVFIDVPAPLVDPEVAFWSAALAVEPEPTSRPKTYTSLTGVMGPGGEVLFEVQRTGEGTASRHHVDLTAVDVAAEAERLESLGASRVAEVENWITLADPVDNLLCVVPPDEP